MPVSGIRPVTPPAITKTWSATIEASPTASSRPKGSRSAEPRAVAALHEQRVQQEDRGQAGQPQLLARRRQDEVGLGGEADQDRVAQPEAGAEHPAGGEREQRLGELVGALARRDRRRTGAASPRPGRAHAAPAGRRRPRPSAASSSPTAIQPVRPVATYSMTTKRPKNSSEVPRSRSRTSTPTLSSQIATIGPSTRPVGSWSRQNRQLAAGVRERVAVGREVRGEEHGEQHLRELARLDGESGDPDPDAGAVHRREEDRQDMSSSASGATRRRTRSAGRTRWSRSRTHDHDEQGRRRASTRPAGWAPPGRRASPGRAGRSAPGRGR